MRKRAGLSIRQLEALTGISRGTLSSIERGIKPTESQLQVILEVIDQHEPKEPPHD